MLIHSSSQPPRSFGGAGALTQPASLRVARRFRGPGPVARDGMGLPLLVPCAVLPPAYSDLTQRRRVRRRGTFVNKEPTGRARAWRVSAGTLLCCHVRV